MKNILETLKHALNGEDNKITFGNIIELAVGKKIVDSNFVQAFEQKQNNWFAPEFDTTKDAIVFIKAHKNEIIEELESEYDNFDDMYWNDFVINGVKCSIETIEELSY